MVDHERLGQIIRFGCVGAAATLVHWLCLVGFIELTGLRPRLATVLAFLIAFMVSYLGHHRFTFRSSAEHVKAAPRFFAVALIGVLANFVIFLVITDVFSASYVLAFGLTIVLVPPLVFTLADRNAFDVNRNTLSYQTVFANWPFWAPSFLIFAISAGLTLSLYHTAPYYDHWEILPFVKSMESGTLRPGPLFALHGSHWHASGYVIMVALTPLTGMAHWAEVAASIVLAGLAFWGLVRILKRAAEQLDAAKALPWLLAISAFFLFSPDQGFNWYWGWQVAVFANLFGTIWCIEALSRGEVRLTATLQAVLAAGFAIYGFATGWALIPIGFALLLLHGAHASRKGLACLGVWSAFTGAMIWHFILASTDKASSYLEEVSPPVFSAQTVFDLMLYGINYVASAVTRFSPEISVPFLVLAILIAGFALWRRAGNWAEVILPLSPFIALAAYAFGSGLLTGYGRIAQFGVDTAFNSRYMTFGSLFWSGFIASLLLISVRQGKFARLGSGFVLLLCVMKVGVIGNVTQKMVPRAIQLRVAVENLRNCYPHVPEADLMRVASPEQGGVREGLAFLEAHQFSLFSVEPDQASCMPEGATRVP